MDLNLAMEDNTRMLKRIVALLFALAGLAERLSNLPRPIRAFVLQILRYAEAVARDFVFETADGQSVVAAPALLYAPQNCDSLADAMRLAQSFRVLAVLLDRLADSTSGGGQRCIAPEDMIARLLAAISLGPLFPVTAQLSVDRRDSS